MDNIFYAVSSFSLFSDEVFALRVLVPQLFSLGGGYSKPVPPVICVLVIAFACFLVRKIVMLFRG